MEAARDYARRHNLLYEYKKLGIHRATLTKEELKSTPRGKIDEKMFDADNPQVNEFIEEYKVPQIDLCQYVRFPGT